MRVVIKNNTHYNTIFTMQSKYKIVSTKLVKYSKSERIRAFHLQSQIAQNGTFGD